MEMAVTAFNEGRLEEAAKWFRDAAAQVDTIRALRRVIENAKKLAAEKP